MQYLPPLPLPRVGTLSFISLSSLSASLNVSFPPVSGEEPSTGFLIQILLD